MAEQLSIAPASAALLEPYLPSASSNPQAQSCPFVTLTFATSLDSSLSLAPGVRTRLSGPESKAMTHYLRSQHSAILIGISTLLADDPGLNCRIAGTHNQPRPIIIDPHRRWMPSRSNKVLQICRDGLGLAPFVITAVPPSDIPKNALEILNDHGGKFIHVEPRSRAGNENWRFDWVDVLNAVGAEGLLSIMVEGGGEIINSLLNPSYQSLINAVIVTIAPTWLGQGGVVVSPERVQDKDGSPLAAARLSDVKWHPFGEDVIMCGRFSPSETADSGCS